MIPPLAESLAVVAEHPVLNTRAAQIAVELGVNCLEPGVSPVEDDRYPLLLCVGPSGLRLQQTGRGAPGPVCVDFQSGAVDHRRRFGGGAGQQIAKAVGIKPGIRPRVADVTAGLGRDAFVLATLGCSVSLVERSPVVSQLLKDGLARAGDDAEVGEIIARMALVSDDGIRWLAAMEPGSEQCPDVVYLDPMFPHSKKTAEVKKEMRLFRALIGDDGDAAELLRQALRVARYRVVVKRPRKAPPIEGPDPSYRLEGRSGRFDIYALHSLTSA